MALEIDGFAVFGAISVHRDAFAELGAEINKTARSLIIKHLKSKALGLAGLRALYSALGSETLALIFDALPDPEIAALAVKFDKHHSDAIKAESAAWRLVHLHALASGEKEPAPRGVAKSKSVETNRRVRKGVTPETELPAPKTGLKFASAGRTRKR